MLTVGLTEVQNFEIESKPGPFEIQYDEEWMAITRKFDSVLALTTRWANFGFYILRMFTICISFTVNPLLAFCPLAIGCTA